MDISEILFNQAKVAIAIKAAELKAVCDTCGGLRSWCDDCEPNYRFWRDAIKANLPMAKVEFIRSGRVNDLDVGEYNHQVGRIKPGLKLMSGIVTPCINSFSDVRARGLSMMFAGENNGGKTTAAVSIALGVQKRRYSAYYCTFPGLHRLHGESFKDESKAELMAAIREVDLLIVDELGKEHSHTDSTRYLADTFIKSREEGLLPTIIITNKLIPDLKPDPERHKYGDYGTSFWAMLGERYRIIGFKDADLRKSNKVEWPF